jgi:CrcB protein
VSGAAVWLGAGALGATGAVARFLIDGAVSRRLAGDVPWGTLSVNLLGSLALGALAGAGLGGDARFIVAGGLLGAFTTFSTWILETQRLAQEGRGWLALANLGLSAALGLGATGLGWRLAGLA